LPRVAPVTVKLTVAPTGAKTVITAKMPMEAVGFQYVTLTVAPGHAAGILLTQMPVASRRMHPAVVT